MQQRIDLDKGYIVVAPVDPTSEHSTLLTDKERALLATMHSPARRAQWATWRTILRRELGADVEVDYTSGGAPVLSHAVGRLSHLSVSHSTEMVAVMFASEPCGVDIESLGRNFSKVATRYIASGERTQWAEAMGSHFEAIMWSAKEALYKYGGREGVDFTHDMIVVEHSAEEHTLRANLFGLMTDTLHYIVADGHVISYVHGRAMGNSEAK